MSMELCPVQLRTAMSNAEDVSSACVSIYNIISQRPGSPPTSVNSVIIRGLANDFPF